MRTCPGLDRTAGNPNPTLPQGLSSPNDTKARNLGEQMEYLASNTVSAPCGETVYKHNKQVIHYTSRWHVRCEKGEQRKVDRQ